MLDVTYYLLRQPSRHKQYYSRIYIVPTKYCACLDSLCDFHLRTVNSGVVFISLDHNSCCCFYMVVPVGLII